MAAALRPDVEASANAMRVKLGLPGAEMVMNGLRTACAFFIDYLEIDPAGWCDYFRGIDFHSPVADDPLPAGTSLSQHLSVGSAREKPFVYFTTPGTSRFSTGTSFPAVRYRRFVTTRLATRALISTASSISFNKVTVDAAPNGRDAMFDRVSRMGGGKQFILSQQDMASLVRVP